MQYNREYRARPGVIERARLRERKSTPEGRARTREYRRKYKFGLLPGDWDALFASQGSCCAICRTVEPGTRHGWATDHDHETGAVRGILCIGCNIALGGLGDKLASVRVCAVRMVRYLCPAKTLHDLIGADACPACKEAR